MHTTATTRLDEIAFADQVANAFGVIPNNVELANMEHVEISL